MSYSDNTSSAALVSPSTRLSADWKLPKSVKPRKGSYLESFCHNLLFHDSLHFYIARKHDRIIPRICYKKKRKQSSGHHSNYLQIRSWKRRPLTAMFLPVPIKKEHWRAESNIPAFLFLKKGSAQFSAVRSARCIIRLISFYSSVNSGSSVSRVRYKILINRFNVSRLLFETLRPDDDDHLIQPILIQLAVVNQLRLTFRQKNLLVIKKSVTLN